MLRWGVLEYRRAKLQPEKGSMEARGGGKTKKGKRKNLLLFSRPTPEPLLNQGGKGMRKGQKRPEGE